MTTPKKEVPAAETDKVVPGTLPEDKPEATLENTMTPEAEAEINRIRAENERLVKENEDLRISSETKQAELTNRAAGDQAKIEALTRQYHEGGGPTDSDAPTLEETHEAALASNARSHMNQNAGAAVAAANQMASNPSHPEAVKTVTSGAPKIRHISEFSGDEPYRGKLGQTELD